MPGEVLVVTLTATISAAASLIVGRDYAATFWIALVCALISVLLLANPANITRRFLALLMQIFFRAIETRGSHHIPEKGPVIFVCAPHSNQFVDAVLVLTTVRRPVRFVIAAKSMRRPFVGLLARILNCIPVERAQDVAKKGRGTISISGNKVTGTDTAFTSEVSEGCSLSVGDDTFPVVSVVSATEAIIKNRSDSTIEDKPYKIQPQLDHDDLYREVHAELKKGGVVGIFPEGGSHDRTELLPFKAGFAVFATGAMAVAKSDPVHIISVGLHYFNGHRFRSRALLDFSSKHIVPSKAQVEAFARGGGDRKLACTEIMHAVEKTVSSVTTSVQDYDTLKLLWAARRLYKPEHVRLSLEETVQLTHQFAMAYNHLADDPRVKKLVEEVRDYNRRLEHNNLKDHQVPKTLLSRRTVLLLLIKRLALLVIETIVVLPILVLGLPTLVVCRTVAERKARQALAGSSVKVEGRDVLATWKLLTALVVVPLCLVAYTALTHFLFGGVAALAVWFFLPPLSLASLTIYDHWILVVQSFQPLLLTLFDKSGGRKLYQQRKELQRKIRSFVAEISEEMNIERMFDDADFEDSNSS